MTRIFQEFFLFLILGLGLLFCVTSGVNCPVNPDCSCSGSYVNCNPECGPSIPKFAASSKKFTEVTIAGTREIIQIVSGTFQALSTKQLTIQNTGITDIGCDAFKGIANDLNVLYLRDNYLEAVPICSLQHVQSVTTLVLTGNHISNVTSNAFNYVDDLLQLYLDQNEIETVELGTFNNMDELENLNLKGNNLSLLDAYIFNGLRSLNSLYLGSNNIKSVHPKAFDGLESLTRLDLNDNEISALDATTFEHLINLRTLRLNRNAILSLPEKIFAKTVKLERLELNDNQLISLPYKIFQTTPLFETLYMERNNLSALDHRLFSLTPDLYDLRIGENRIANIEQGTFRDLRKLSYLNLTENRLMTMRPDVVKGCDRLYRLMINKNRIIDLEVGCFKNLSNLYQLDLSENNLNEIRAGVFTNSTRLYDLNLADNRISFIENGSLNNQQTSLNSLNLRSNKLSQKTWVTLTPLLTKLDNLRSLDLSNNPIGEISTPVSLRQIYTGNFRNCSLTSIQFNGQIRRLDISANHIQSISIEGNHYNIYGYLVVDVLKLSNNFMSDSLVLTADIDVNVYTRITELDLSYNIFNKVTTYPVWFNSSRPVDLYSRITIHQLNLSHNNIRFVSPYAFLGLIRTLDLSHNRIEVFGRLLPANISSSKFRTRYLDLSDNRIHIIISDAFQDYENIIQTINLANNTLTEITTLQKVLEEGSFQKLYLSGNPLNCDCDLFWLRQDAVSSKLDSGRCNTPDNAKDYISFCYPLENCPPQQKTDTSASVLELCKNDKYVSVSNVKLISLESVGVNPRVNLSWIRHGPGKITGYKIEMTPHENSDKMITPLVHSGAVYWILSDLKFEVAYNVCISAQRNEATASEIMCSSLTLEATDDNIILSKSILIGISSALGLCVLLIVAMLLAYFIRRHKTVTIDSANAVRSEIIKSHTPKNLSESQNNPSNLNDNQNNCSSLTETQHYTSNPVSKSQYRPEDYENPSYVGDDVTNTYEAIHSTVYENN